MTKNLNDCSFNIRFSKPFELKVSFKTVSSFTQSHDIPMHSIQFKPNSQSNLLFKQNLVIVWQNLSIQFLSFWTKFLFQFPSFSIKWSFHLSGASKFTSSQSWTSFWIWRLSTSHWKMLSCQRNSTGKNCKLIGKLIWEREKLQIKLSNSL